MADTFQERFTGQPDEVVQGQEGLVQTVPKAFELGSQLLTGLAKEPGNLVQGLLDFFKTPGKAVSQGLTPEEEINFGFNAALGTAGAGAFKAPKGLVDAHVAFQDQVLKPAAERLVSNPDAVSPPLGTDVPANVTRSELAQTGNPHIDAVLNSPVTKSVIDNPAVNRQYDVPYTAGGSVPLENPAMYIDRNFPRAISVDGKTFDPADPFIVHENVEQHTMDLLIKGGMSEADAYRVAHYEFAEKAEGAWYQSHGIDQEKAEAIYTPLLRDDMYKQGELKLPPNLYDRPYPHDEPMRARDDDQFRADRPTPELIDRAKKIVADWQEKGSPAPEPEKPPTVNPLQEAHELGVIGPERMPHPEDTPAQAAQRAIPVGRRYDPNDKITMTPAGEPLSGWEARFKDWTERVKSPEDFKSLWFEAAKENNNFPEARAGRVDAAHVEALAESAGIDPALIDRSYIKKTFDGPDMIRVAKQTLDQMAKEFKDASAKVEADPSPANVAAMLQAEIKRDYALEQAVGLRAEWGRTGHALNSLLQSSKTAGGQTGLAGELKERLAPPKPVKDVVDAVDKVKEKMVKAVKGEEGPLGLDDLIKAAFDLVDEAAKPKKPGEKPSLPMSPEVKELVKTAQAVVNLMDYERPKGPGIPTVRPLRQLITDKTPEGRSALSKFNTLVSEAEKNVSGQIRQGKTPRQAMPDELAKMISAAENITEHFGGAGLEKAVQDLLASKGRSIEDMQDIAKGVRNLSTAQAARVLSNMRGKQPHWFYWMWVQGLISGPFTHAKYIAANALYAAVERGITTPLAALLGRLRTGPDKVMPGEAWRMNVAAISAFPDAVRAAYQSVKDGVRPPTEAQRKLFDRAVESGEGIPKEYLRAVNPVTQQEGRPIPGVAGRVLGAPGDMAGAIHTTFRVVGEQAYLDAEAFRATTSEGLRQTDQKFWERFQYHKLNPTDEALKRAEFMGARDTFMQDLPPIIAKKAAALKEGAFTKWIFPFNHIPINLLRAANEYVPLLNLIDSRTRSALKGEMGGREQDLAISRMTVGSLAMGYFVHQYMLGQANGAYPSDPKERDEWKLNGKIPNSIRIGDQWISFERFGPAGALAGLGADVGSLIAHSNMADPENWTKLTWLAANAAANVLADAPGYQSLRNMIEAKEDFQQGKRFVAWEAGSAMVPFSSLVTQTASALDPQMRLARTFLDGLMYRMPGMREDLSPKRDPLYGEPVANPGYMNIIRKAPVEHDLAKSELTKIGYYPHAPSQQIGGVKLSPEQYDKYQATAGPLVKQQLDALVRSPEWQANGPEWKTRMAKATISYARRYAAQAMQIDDPSLIMAGRERRLKQIGH